MTSTDSTDVKATGRRIMNELMGDGYVEKKDKNRNDFNDGIQDYSEEVCFGRIWAREGIDRKTRSIINPSVLTALGRQPSSPTTSRARSTTAPPSPRSRKYSCRPPCTAACPRRARPSRSPRASCGQADTSTEHVPKHGPPHGRSERGRPT